MVKVLVDVGQVVIIVGGGGIFVICEGNYLCGVSVVIDKDWVSVCLAEMIDVDMLIILIVVEKVVINFGKENEQWFDCLLLSDVECFIEEGYFVKGFMLFKVEAVVLFVCFCVGCEVLIIVLSKVKEGIEGKIGMVICQ